jgi:hypothetical protein
LSYSINASNYRSSDLHVYQSVKPDGKFSGLFIFGIVAFILQLQKSLLSPNQDFGMTFTSDEIASVSMLWQRYSPSLPIDGGYGSGEP